MPQSFCEACGALGAKLCCGRCHEACYCNIVCQRDAWKKGHKSKCVPKTGKPPSAARAAPPPPPTTAAPRSSGDGGVECAICIDALQQPQTMPCGHRFCRGCVASMREHGVGEAQVCPLCRGPMPDVERLHLESARLLVQVGKWQVGGWWGQTLSTPATPCFAGGAPRPPWVQKLLRRAAGLCREVLAMDPEHAGARFQLASALDAAGDADGALSAHRAVCAADPQNGFAQNNLGTCLQESGDTAGAEAAYRAAIAAEPHRPLAHYNLGTLLTQRQDLAGAETAFRATTAADPLFKLGHFNLGSVLGMRGDNAGAAASFAKVLQIDPSFAPAKQMMAKLAKVLAKKR